MILDSCVTTRIDIGIKKQAEEILDCLGLTVSMAFRLFLVQIVLRNGLPFPVELPTVKKLDDNGHEEEFQIDAHDVVQERDDKAWIRSFAEKK